MTDQEFEQLRTEAEQLGREAGENAASWWEQDAIGGRVTNGSERETARRVLKGMEDGDPEIIDALPYPNLSGEWAGDPTPITLMADLEAPEDITPEDEDELCRAWEDAAVEACQLAIERSCRELLS